MEILILFGISAWVIVWGGFGVYVATQKGRSAGEGIVFGIVLGPIGLLIVACLPVQDKSDPSSWVAPKPVKTEEPDPEDEPLDLERIAHLR